MIDADERRGFGQAISLNDGVPEAPPKFFGNRVQGSAAANEPPELPAELAMDAAKTPPTVQEALAFGRAETLPELVQRPSGFQVALYFFFQ